MKSKYKKNEETGVLFYLCQDQIPLHYRNDNLQNEISLLTYTLSIEVLL